MTDPSSEGTGLGGVLRLTWVTDDLAHVLQRSQADDPPGTWTGLACPGHGLDIGSDVDTATLRRLAQGEIADLIWEASPDFTARHGQLCHAAIQAHQSGNPETGEKLWQQAQTLWSRAWSANHQALGLMQNAGLTRFSPHKPSAG